MDLVINVFGNLKDLVGLANAQFNGWPNVFYRNGTWVFEWHTCVFEYVIANF